MNELIIDQSIEGSFAIESERNQLIRLEEELIDYINNKNIVQLEKKLNNKIQKTSVISLGNRFNLDAKVEKIEEDKKQLKFENNAFLYRIIFTKNEKSRIPFLFLSDFLDSEKRRQLKNEKDNEKINFDKACEKPIIKGRGNFMWTSKNEIQNQNEEDLLIKIKNMNINEVYDDTENDNKFSNNSPSTNESHTKSNYYYPQMNQDIGKTENKEKQTSNNFILKTDHLLIIESLQDQQENEIHEILLKYLNSNNLPCSPIQLKNIDKSKFILICDSQIQAENISKKNIEGFNITKVNLEEPK